MSNIEKLDGLFEGGVKVVFVGQKRGLMGSMIVAAVLAVGAGGLYMHNQSDNSVSTKDPSVISTIKNTVEQAVNKQENKIEINQNQETKFPIYGNFIKDEKIKNQIEQMGNFSLPDGMKPNQISRHVAQKMFKLGNYAGYTTSLISEREGFVSSLYNDVGWYAIGNGANLGVQSQSHIKNVFGTISTDKEYINNFAALSGKHVDGIVPPNHKDMNVSPQRSIQLAMVMSQTFENSVINSFSKYVKGSAKAKEVFESLKDNEKAALVNVAYQKGSLSSNEAKSVVNYALDPNKTPEKALAAIDTVSITYMNNGTRITDTRAEILAKSLFSNLPVFEKVISNNIKPKDISNYSSIFKGHTKSTSSGEIVLDDPIGAEKEKALAAGQVWKGTIAPSVDLNAMRTKPRAVLFGI
jgi:hypothetical protein